MLSQKAKDLFAKMNLEFSPIAIKYRATRPEGVEHCTKKKSLCQFVRHAQDTGKMFYISADDENCVGRTVLGMEEKAPIAASGQAGFDFGVYKTQGANARLYQLMPTMIPGTVNFVIFAPVAVCDFDPDLVIFVADTENAELLMRATSYISGDLWESRTSPVLSCAWTYVYPYISGKVNFCVTGMHHGMSRRKVYPKGLHIIAVPYQKLDEIVLALDQMDWTLISFRPDEESQQELARRMAHWGEMSAEINAKSFSLPENKI